MRSRKRVHDEVPADDGGLADWLHDLVDGETTARRLRQRLNSHEGPAEHSCAVCDGAATGTVYFGPDGHLHGRRSA